MDGEAQPAAGGAGQEGGMNLKRPFGDDFQQPPPLKIARRSTTPTNDEDDDMNLFYISTTPSASTTDCPPTLISYTYLAPHSSSFADPLPILGLSPSTPSKDSTSSDRQCFNCLGPHNLSACPFRRDNAIIAANRAAFQEEHGMSGGGAKLGGEDTERRQMLDLAERFRAGVVSRDLKEALGYGSEEREGEVVEYPWFCRMREWGYPPGWVLYGGGREPLDLVRERIGRDEAWEDIEILQIFGDKESSPSPSTSTNRDREDPSSDDQVETPLQISITLPSSSTSPPSSHDKPPLPPIPAPQEPFAPPPPLPTEPPPPLPPGSPPPLPPGPPPPLPPGSPPLPPPVRLVDYPTYLFSSLNLAIHRPDLPLPFSNPRGVYARRAAWVPEGGEGMCDSTGRASPWEWRGGEGTSSKETPVLVQRTAVEEEVADGEVEMDMSSSGDES